MRSLLTSSAAAAASLAMLVACASVPATLPETYTAEDLARLDAALAGPDYPATTSLIVVKEGEIILERYFGNGSAEKLNDTRSATKTVIAMATGIAIEEGILKSEDALIWPLLSQYAPPGAGDALTQAITVRDLLTMTSAFDCDDNNDTPGNEENMYPQASWKAFALALPSMEGWAREADGLGPWRYCTAGSFLLGQTIQEASGERIDDFVRTRIFEPMDIERAQWDTSPSGEIQTGGGLELSARDLAKLGWMMTQKGMWESRRILPESWVARMLTAYRPAFAEMSYGYQMWTRSYQTPCGAQDAWFMAGNGGNQILSFPGLNAVIVLTREAYNTRGMHPQSFELVEKFVLPPLACPVE